jgi:hypothetical protein
MPYFLGRFSNVENIAFRYKVSSNINLYLKIAFIYNYKEDYYKDYYKDHYKDYYKLSILYFYMQPCFFKLTRLAIV